MWQPQCAMCNASRAILLASTQGAGGWVCPAGAAPAQKQEKHHHWQTKEGGDSLSVLGQRPAGRQACRQVGTATACSGLRQKLLWGAWSVLTRLCGSEAQQQPKQKQGSMTAAAAAAPYTGACIALLTHLTHRSHCVGKVCRPSPPTTDTHVPLKRGGKAGTSQLVLSSTNPNVTAALKAVQCMRAARGCDSAVLHCAAATNIHPKKKPQERGKSSHVCRQKPQAVVHCPDCKVSLQNSMQWVRCYININSQKEECVDVLRTFTHTSNSQARQRCGCPEKKGKGSRSHAEQRHFLVTSPGPHHWQPTAAHQEKNPQKRNGQCASRVHACTVRHQVSPTLPDEGQWTVAASRLHATACAAAQEHQPPKGTRRES